MNATIFFAVIFLAEVTAQVNVVSTTLSDGDSLCLVKNGDIRTLSLVQQGNQLLGEVPNDAYTRILVANQPGWHIPTMCNDGDFTDCSRANGRVRLKIDRKKIDTFSLTVKVTEGRRANFNGIENLSLSLHHLDCSLGGTELLSFSEIEGETIHF